MKLADLKNGWAELSTKGKLMAAGTAALLAFSLCFSLGSSTLLQEAGERASFTANVTVEEGVEIPYDADPIVTASEDTLLVTKLVDVLASEDCVWVSADDDLRWIEFTKEGFTEYNGDIATTATVEFYSIGIIENGRAGTWRITYEDGSIYDASFLFIQNRETGVYALTSSAFPMKTYLCKAITGEDVLAW